MPQLRTIVIVGGGFSGTAVAANLLRGGLQGPTRLVIVERNAVIGPGVAYAPRPQPYLLNVPAGRMSAMTGAPLDFLQFAQRRLPEAGGEDFLPRSLYGEYLEEWLLTSELLAPRNVRFERWRGTVVGIRRIARHLPLEVQLEDGRRLTADDVVLAPGNPPPASLAAAKAVLDHPAYVANPWAGELRLTPQQRVLLIGTGLTAVDFITTLAADVQHAAELHALSRHGFVPPRQTAFRPDAFRGDGNALLLAAATSLRGLTRSVRLLAEEAERCGGDWREAITFVRHMAPTIWQRMAERDRRRFLRHLRAHWDMYRHRLPAVSLQRVDALRSSGRLKVHAGRIQWLQPKDARIEVTWRPRGAAALQSMTFDKVINCTGPDYAVDRLNDPLWRNLVQCGLCVADAHGLGLRTGPNSAVVDADGWPGTHLFYVGPMLRADHWEATAVAELRVHAERLAKFLCSDRRTHVHLSGVA